MRTRTLILSFIAIILINGLCFADNSQFHKREYQEPIFESNSMWEAIGYTGVDVEKNVAIKTENYIHYMNFSNNHAVVFHKVETMLFIIMGDLKVRAYFVFGMTMNSGNKWWSVYEILIEDEDNTYTIMYKEMVEELRVIANVCVRQKKNFI